MWCVRTLRFVSQTKHSKQFIPLRRVIGGLSSFYCSVSAGFSDNSVHQRSNFSDDSQHQISNPFRITKTTSTPTSQLRLQEAAMQVFRQLKNNETDGFFKPPDLPTYRDIIRILCYWRMNTMLDSLLLELVKSKDLGVDDLFTELEIELSVEEKEEDGYNYLVAHALDAMNKAYVSAGMFDEAIDDLCWVDRRGLGKPLLSACSFLIDHCGNLDWAVNNGHHYVQLNMKEGKPPNIHAYGILMKALFRKGNMKEAAYKVFRETLNTVKDGMTIPDYLPFTSIYIEELCSHGLPSRAEEILHDMENQHGLVPDAYCYGALIRGYCQAGDPISALDVHCEMRAKDIKTNSGIASTILHSLCQVGMFAEAVDQLKYFQELGIDLSNVVIDAGKYEETFSGMLEEMKMKGKGISPDDDVTCKQQVKGGGGEPAMQVFRQLKNNEYEHDGFFKPPDLPTYVAIIRILCYWSMDALLNSLLLEVVKSKKEHLGFDASDLFLELDFELGQNVQNVEEMEEASYLVAQALDALAKAFVSVGMFDEVIDRLCAMSSRCPEKPLLPACTFLMDRLVDCGEVDSALYDAQLSMEFSEKEGKPPSVHAYGILMKALFRKDNLGKADDVFRKTVKAGMTQSNLPFTCIYVEELCSHGLPSRAEDILRDMEKQHGLMPDEYCYETLIHGYCQAGDPIRAISLHSEMRAKNMKTNPAIVTTILDCLCKIGMFGEAVYLPKYFQQLRIYLDNVVHDAVMDERSSGEGSELKLLKEMERNGMKPDEVVA